MDTVRTRHLSAAHGLAAAIILTLPTLTLTAPHADAAVLTQTDVFVSGQDGYNTFRIPAIVRADNGDLLAFAEGRVNSSSDHGDIDIVMKRSTDQGATWGSLQVVHDNWHNVAGNPVPILDTSTGNLVLISNQQLAIDSQSDIQNGTSYGPRTVWTQTSTNDGATWSHPKSITYDVMDYDDRFYLSGPGGGTQLNVGAYAGRLIAAGAHSRDTTGGSQNGIHTIYSDDGGATWHRGAAAPNSIANNYLPSESQVVELNDGTVYVNSRNRAGTTGNFFRGVAKFTAGGQTLSTSFRETQLIDPKVEGSLERFTSTANGDDANRILFVNPTDELLRRQLTVHASYDETSTWTRSKLIHRGPAAYSDMVVTTASGTINPYMGVLYEQGVTGPTGRITFARFNRSWLEDPGLQQIDFRTYSPSSTISASTTIYDKEGNGVNGVLEGNGVPVSNSSTAITADLDSRYVDPELGNGRTISFDGQTDMIRFTDNLTDDFIFDFEAGESFTLEAVFSTTNHGSGGATGSGPLIAKDVGAGTPSYWLRIQDGKVRFLLDDGTNVSSVTSATSVTNGDWFHVAAVRDVDNGQLKIYINEVLDATATDITTGDFSNNNDLLIGAFNASSPGSKRYNGDMLLTRISLGALSPASPGPLFNPEPSTATLTLTLTGTVLMRMRAR